MDEKELIRNLLNSSSKTNSTNKIIDSNGNVSVPGIPIILPGRGVNPKEGEYLDSSKDSGITKDVNKIEELKIKNQRDVIENALLGKFDGNGVYSVAEDISKELIDMVKVLSEKENQTNEYMDTEEGKVQMLPGVIYIETISEFGGVGKFNFAIQTYYTGLQTSSELFLLEDVKKADGFIQNINIYSVGKYTEAFGSNYKRNMFRYFNIVSKELANKMNDEEKLLFGWAYRRKMYLKMLAAFGNGKYQIAEADYLNAKIEALSSLGAYGATVISMFNDLQERAKSILGKELSARDLNDLLDIIIDDMASKYPQMTKMYHSAIHGATLTYSNEIKVITESNATKAKEATKNLSKHDSMAWSYAKANKIEKLKVPKAKKDDKEKENDKGKVKNKGKAIAPTSKPTVIKPTITKPPITTNMDERIKRIVEHSYTFNLAGETLENPEILSRKLDTPKKDLTI